jgi:hypothetical protein
MKTIFIALFLFTAIHLSYGQNIPQGSCGVMFTYDNGGNRIKREYLCPAARVAAPAVVEKEIEKIETAYPNPSDGNVTLYFSRGLEDATITVMDVNGNFIRQLKGSGTKLNIDLNNVPDGIYIIRIDKKDEKVIKRIVKVSN